MPFERPTLEQLNDRAQADVAARLPGAEPLAARGNLQVLTRVHAGAVHGQYGYLGYLAAQLMPDTAEAEYLARWAAIWGIERKPEAKAGGVLEITGTDGALIFVGALYRRADGERYQVQAEVQIAGGTGVVEVLAELAGTVADTVAGAALSLVSPLEGIKSAAVAGADGLTGGADAEGDASLLARLLTRIQEPPHGGADSDYVAWALEMPGVTRAWSYPLRMGAGTVGLCFTTDDSPAGIIPSPDEVTAVQDYINERRPVTAQVDVFAPEAAPLNFEITLTPDSPAVRAAVLAELTDLILREAEPEGAVLISHIREAISIAAGESDHVLAAPVANVAAGAGEIITMGEITWS